MASKDGLGGSPGRDQMTHLRGRKPLKYGASGEDAIGNLEKGQGLRANRVRSKAAAIKAKERVMFVGAAREGLPVDPVRTAGRRG